MTASDILQTVGNTTLMELRNIVPADHARIFVKLETENPTGSMKDRMALAMIEAAEADGRLKPGGSVVEYTGGSTGVSLALVCNVKGYPLRIVTSDAFSAEKRGHMQALGAELTIIKSDNGKNTKKLTLDMIEAARVIGEKYGSYATDQLNNHDPIIAYNMLGDEIWDQTSGKIDAFVQSVGTASSLRGIGETLRKYKPEIRIDAVEPAESAVLSGGNTGAHNIEGTGAGFVVPLWQEGIADTIHRISTNDAMAMARRLAREEALFAGTSTGANVLAALSIAKEIGPDGMVVTLAVDQGIKYLSTPLYSASDK